MDLDLERVRSLRIIPLLGEWVSWEFYKEVNNIQEGGYIGDAINGEYVHSSVYEEYLHRELETGLP